MNIAYFISDHGFGHIMRNLSVISELLRNGHKVVLVTGKKHIELAKRYLEKESNIENLVSIEMNTDGGLIVKPGTLIVDKDATKKMVDEYVKSFPKRIEIAKEIFLTYDIERVVVDIVPWALTAAKEKRIKSYLMASFTWMEQYEGYVDESLMLVLDKSFNDAENVLMYELANEPTKNRYPNHQKVGFVVRPFHEDKVCEIQRLHKRPIVFLSLGGSNSGLDFDIDVSQLPYDFIATEGLRLHGENVYFLPVNVENTQDYMKAAELCISKSGWSSVAELMLSGTKTALLTRPDVPEDTMIIEQLVKRNEIIAVSVDELKNMKKLIDRMNATILNNVEYTNNYRKIVRIIIS